MAVCGPVWHQLDPNAYDIVWFRLATRMRDEHGTYIYRVGREPSDDACRTIWCYGDRGVAWICGECRQSIGVERSEDRIVPPDGDQPRPLE